jgi:hypothetical protein
MSNSFHTIELTGRLIFESSHSNFRTALSDYLSKSEDDGIQMQITNARDKSEHEDIVVRMQLLRMKQHPMDNIIASRNNKRPAKPVKIKSTDSDTAFY